MWKERDSCCRECEHDKRKHHRICHKLTVLFSHCDFYQFLYTEKLSFAQGKNTHINKV